jgi:hypothetical protein
MYLADPVISLQMRESCKATESVEVRRSPRRSSDVFQRCSNRSAPVSRSGCRSNGSSRLSSAPSLLRREGSYPGVTPALDPRDRK